jgi:NAD(P)-dependent dehydrogenase (short-subunit alcohol dehydrogenase family)
MTPDNSESLTGKVMQKSVLVTGCSSGIGLESALDLKRQGFNVLAACRKAEDVARMQELGLTGVAGSGRPQSVERAAAEVIALTDNRLYGLFNNAYGVYGPLPPSAASRWSSSFPPTFSAPSAHHAAASGDGAARRRAHRDDLVGDGADLQPRPRRLCRQ